MPGKKWLMLVKMPSFGGCQNVIKMIFWTNMSQVEASGKISNLSKIMIDNLWIHGKCLLGWYKETTDSPMFTESKKLSWHGWEAPFCGFLFLSDPLIKVIPVKWSSWDETWRLPITTNYIVSQKRDHFLVPASNYVDACIKTYSLKILTWLFLIILNVTQRTAVVVRINSL